MDVRLSPEQQALRDAVAHVVGDLGPATVADLDDRERANKLDAAAVAGGWRELRTAHDTGGPWASGVEVAVVAEQLARGRADTAFIGPTLAAELRRLAGAPAATAPETVLVSADLGGIAVAADDRVPAGAFAVDAAGATTALLLKSDQDTRSLLTVELEGPVAGTDLTRAVASPARVIGVRVVDDRATGLGDNEMARLTALGLAATCADLVGAMQGAVDLTTGYASERRQYGQPIGSFQAVQHLLADALVATEGSRSISLYAAWAVDALDPQAAVVGAAAAKAYAARAARVVCETAIQVHGGIGNTWECLAHVDLRRSLLSTELLGGIDASLTRVAHHHELTGARTPGGTDGLR